METKSASSDLEDGGMPRALQHGKALLAACAHCRMVGRGWMGEGYIMARRTSPMGMTPSLSPSMGSEKSPKASLISASSCAVMLFSLASLDGRVFVVPEPDS